MSDQCGKVGAAVSLILALACAGTARADSTLALGSQVFHVLVVTGVGPGFAQFRAVGPPSPPVAARPLGMFSASGHWSSLFASGSRLLSPVRRAGNHVLALSLLGVFGMLALRRLNRTA